MNAIKRYKMYKSKKRWLIAGATGFIAIAMGVLGGQVTADADATPVTPTVTVQQTTTVVPKENVKNVVAPAETSPVTTSVTKSEVVKQPVSTDKVTTPKTNAVATSVPAPVDKQIIKGISGTAHWEFDPTNGVVTVGAGNLGGAEAQISSGTLEEYENSEILFQGLTKDAIKHIDFRPGVVAPLFSSHLLAGYKNLLTIDHAENLDMSHTRRMDNVISYDPLLRQVDVSKWDTRNVEDMLWAFAYDDSLKALDVSGWNTSKVTRMSGMFEHDSTLKSLDVDLWDMSNVTDIGSMFQDDVALTTVNFRQWNTSHITDMGFMFQHDRSLNNIDVSHWNMSNVTDLAALFDGTTSLTNIDVSHWDTSKVTNMGFVFANNTSLQNIDVSHWNTSRVNDLDGIFYRDPLLTNINLNGWDTSKVANMSYMFAEDTNLKTVGMNGWDTSSLKDVTRMFFIDRKLTNLDLSNWDTSKISLSKWDTMLFGAEALWQLKLGSKFVIPANSGIFLQQYPFEGVPIPDTNGTHIVSDSSWRAVETGTVYNPAGKTALTANTIFDKYRTAGGPTETYVWAQHEENVTVHFIDQRTGKEVFGPELVTGAIGQKISFENPLTDTRYFTGFDLSAPNLPLKGTSIFPHYTINVPKGEGLTMTIGKSTTGASSMNLFVAQPQAQNWTITDKSTDGTVLGTTVIHGFKLPNYTTAQTMDLMQTIPSSDVWTVEHNGQLISNVLPLYQALLNGVSADQAGYQGYTNRTWSTFSKAFQGYATIEDMIAQLGLNGFTKVLSALDAQIDFVNVFVGNRQTIGTYTSSRTIHYEGAGNKTPNNIVEPVTWFTVTNLTNGQVTYQILHQADGVISPSIEGYVPNQYLVPASTISNEILTEKPVGTQVDVQYLPTV